MRKKEWLEQAVVVKKIHPFGHYKEGAVRVADRHSKGGTSTIVEKPKSFTVIKRPKRCFRTFRSQKRGDLVTVVWGKLKKGASRSRSCR